MAKLSYLEANKLVEELVLAQKRQIDEITRQKIIDYSNCDTDLIKYFFDNNSDNYPCSNLKLLSRSEHVILNTLFKHLGNIVSRDMLGESLWDMNWYDLYSDWSIDTHLSSLRKKLDSNWKIVTKRERGYVLERNDKHLRIPDESFVKEPQTVQITQEYIDYMNNPKNVRKTLYDLFKSLGKTIFKPKNILVVNSFSIENISHLNNWINEIQTKPEVCIFSNFNESIIKYHQEEINNLNLENFSALYDDINLTRLKENYFDLIINDFRLNFNNNHMQNLNSMKNMNKLLKNDSQVLLSVVVDPRYESKKYGKNQEKAPINKNSPCTFEADEHLPRKCFTVSYYKQLIKKSGFKILSEFDLLEGKRWIKNLDQNKKFLPTYRRYLLKKTSHFK